MAKPPLPRRLRIGHATYTIKADRKACEADDANGITFPDERTITVHPDKPADKLREVLLHETLHGCLDAAQAGLPAKQEERVVSLLTGPLLAALRDNRDTLVPFLLHED